MESWFTVSHREIAVTHLGYSCATAPLVLHGFQDVAFTGQHVMVSW